MGVGKFQNIRNNDFVPNSSFSACSKYQFVLEERGGGLTKVVSAVAVSECPLEAAHCRASAATTLVTLTTETRVASAAGGGWTEATGVSTHVYTCPVW